ncbi:MAG: sulfite exporter TauE/SafE family protein [Cyclobacteriaceae bacterium]|nr:sulfite exporter TauE/SafE family protein [Cyclobacteriaceae bacterium]
MAAELVLFFLLTLLSEILGTVGGFGSSLFFVSVAQFFFPFQAVLALTGLLHVFSNTAKLVFFWRTIDKKLLLWLGISSAVCAVAGAMLLRWVELEYAKLVLSLFLIGFSLFMLFTPSFKVNNTLRNAVGGGALAGFLAGFVGTGGAVRGLVLASFQLEKNMLIGTSAAIDFAVDLLRSLVYLDSNFLPDELLPVLPLLLVAAFGGSYLGKLIVNRISQTLFRKVLLSLVFLLGVLMLVKEWLTLCQSC